MANKPSRKKRKLARERSERAREHDLPAAVLSAPLSRGRAAASALGGSGRSRRDEGSGDDDANDSDDPSSPGSSTPRPNLWRRMPAGAKLAIFLVLAFGMAGVVIAVLRSRS
jgi:hypothetical protein